MSRYTVVAGPTAKLSAHERPKPACGRPGLRRPRATRASRWLVIRGVQPARGPPAFGGSGRRGVPSSLGVSTQYGGRDEACPLRKGGGTRRVHLVRGTVWGAWGGEAYARRVERKLRARAADQRTKTRERRKRAGARRGAPAAGAAGGGRRAAGGGRRACLEALGGEPRRRRAVLGLDRALLLVGERHDVAPQRDAPLRGRGSVLWGRCYARDPAREGGCFSTGPAAGLRGRPGWGGTEKARRKVRDAACPISTG